MKRDPYFKYIAAALIAGVLLAFLGPSTVQPARSNPVVASTAAPASVRG